MSEKTDEEKIITNRDVLLYLGMDVSTCSESQIFQAFTIMKRTAKVVAELVVNPSSIDSFDSKMEEYGIEKGKMKELVNPFLETPNKGALPPSSTSNENRKFECDLITKKEFSEFQERIFCLLENHLRNPIRIVKVVKEEKTDIPEEKEKIESDDGNESSEGSDDEGKKKKNKKLKRVRPLFDLSRFSHFAEQMGNTLAWRESIGANVCFRDSLVHGVYKIAFVFRNVVKQGGNITVGICTPEWAEANGEGDYMGNDSNSLDWNRNEGLFHSRVHKDAPKFDDNDEISLEVDMNRHMLFFYHGLSLIPVCYVNIPGAVKVGFYINQNEGSCVVNLFELKCGSVSDDKLPELEKVSW